jgi:tuberculosinol/isotuberculosinol synthase
MRIGLTDSCRAFEATMTSLEGFLQLPTEEAAALVRASGQIVCVFPFNGTRRWFLLEHCGQNQRELAENYLEETVKGYIRLYKLLFEHGVETIIAPVFGKEILERGEEYMTAIGESMTLLADHPDFLSFYKDCDVRVRFYGDYRTELETRSRHIVDSFDETTELTLAHNTHRLFYGVFADDATQAIARLAIQYYQTHNKPPGKHDLIEMYYGERIEKADLFIGFEKFTVFDYPMLNTGNESLYFTVAPSLFMTETLLRKILFDHIYHRPLREPDYQKVSQDDLEAMRKAYLGSRDSAFGVGTVERGVWYAGLTG